MVSSNDEYFDSILRHQIYLLRYSGSVRNKIIEILNASEKEISTRIQMLLNDGEGISPSNLKRLKKLLAEIKEIRSKDWDKINPLWESSLIEFSKLEAETYAAITVAASPVIIEPKLPLTPMLKSIAVEEFFQGKNIRQWSKHVQASDLNRISDQIRLGLSQNESNRQIASRVIGTASLKGKDGVTQITRKNAEAITRTAINHIGNRVKQEFAKANPDIVSEEVYVATLDGRTTAVCRSNDGNFYPVGKGPMPPLHFGCRSLRIPLLDRKLLGERPSKPVTKKMLLKKFSEENNLPFVSERESLPKGYRLKFDEFSRKEIRNIVGQVTADVNYSDWLVKQPIAFQDEVLGKTKAKLFRDGKLSLDKFVNRNGDELTLEQLRLKYAEAFR